MRLRICCEIKGLGIDENGNPCPAGASIDFGEISEDIPYESIVADIDKERLLRSLFLDQSHTPDDIVFITPEEYDKEYGDDA